MFDSLLGAAKSLLGGAGDGTTTPDQLAGAISDHVGGLDPSELVNHLTGMVPNLPDDARAQLGTLVEDAAANPAGLKDAAIAFVQNNPQLVQQYAPELWQGILAKIGA